MCGCQSCGLSLRAGFTPQGHWTKFTSCFRRDLLPRFNKTCLCSLFAIKTSEYTTVPSLWIMVMEVPSLWSYDPPLTNNTTL